MKTHDVDGYPLRCQVCEDRLSRGAAVYLTTITPDGKQEASKEAWHAACRPQDAPGDAPIARQASRLP